MKIYFFDLNKMKNGLGIKGLNGIKVLLKNVNQPSEENVIWPILISINK